MKRIFQIFYWLWRWLSWTILLVLTGAALGILLYLIGTPLFSVDKSLQQILIKGAQNGGFYFFVWAPGSSIVLCFIEAFGARLAGTYQHPLS